MLVLHFVNPQGRGLGHNQNITQLAHVNQLHGGKMCMIVNFLLCKQNDNTKLTTSIGIPKACEAPSPKNSKFVVYPHEQDGVG